jgi:hypothetical protein
MLPAVLLNEVDAIVLSGLGGYGTRQEFFLEAIQNHALEVRHGVADGERFLIEPELSSTRPIRVEALSAEPASTTGDALAVQPMVEEAVPRETPLPTALTDGPPIEPISDLRKTGLVVPDRGAVIEDGIARYKDEPLFGLHNRDFPTFWAVARLAELTPDEPIPAPQFFEIVTRDAWRFGQSLVPLEKETKVKLTALFPSNFVKPQSAEEGFRSFAIGTIARRPTADDTFDTTGPFFQWGIAQIVKPNGTPRLGLTPAGWELLRSLDGLELAWPHRPEQARVFFAFLKKYAPQDWRGFEQLLKAVTDAPNRAELSAHFQRWQPSWSDAVANTNSAGFIARGREWGLIEPKLVDGRYALTSFGQQIADEEGKS